jgi:hypothetical protein
MKRTEIRSHLMPHYDVQHRKDPIRSQEGVQRDFHRKDSNLRRDNLHKPMDQREAMMAKAALEDHSHRCVGAQWILEEAAHPHQQQERLQAKSSMSMPARGMGHAAHRQEILSGGARQKK